MNILGFLLLLLAGAGAGLSAAGEIRRSLRRTEAAIRLGNRMRFFVCVRHLALPETMARLGDEFSWLYRPPGEREAEMRRNGFLHLWRDEVQSAGFPPVSESVLLRIGAELSDGEDPERVFAAALSELQSYREVFRTRNRETGRLYPVVGLSAGCMLGILLL